MVWRLECAGYDVLWRMEESCRNRSIKRCWLGKGERWRQVNTKNYSTRIKEERKAAWDGRGRQVSWDWIFEDCDQSKVKQTTRKKQTNSNNGSLTKRASITKVLDSVWQAGRIFHKSNVCSCLRREDGRPGQLRSDDGQIWTRAVLSVMMDNYERNKALHVAYSHLPSTKRREG